MPAHMPTLATMMLGLWSGEWLKSARPQAEKLQGLVVGGAKDHRRSTFCQFDQQRVAPGDAMGMDDDGSDLVEGDAADGLAILLHLQKATIPGEMAALFCNINDLIQRHT